MLVPFRYIKLFLTKPLTPREAWIQVVGAIYNDGLQVACAAMVDWLRIALTRQGQNAASRLGQAFPPVPLVTPELHHHRWNLVVRDLPALSEGVLMVAGNNIAAGLNALVADNRIQRQLDENRRQSEQSKTPEKFFGDVGVMKLLRLCQVGTADELPPLWHTLGETPKRQHIVAIQQAFDQTAMDLNLGASPIPITPDIVSKIQTVSFQLTNFRDLSTGIHPFIFGYMSQSQATDAKGDADQFLLVQSGLGAPTLTEARTLITPSKIRLPLTLMQTAITLQNFRIAATVLFGEEHALTLKYESFMTMWASEQHDLLELSIEKSAAFPSLIVRWVQNRVSLWIGKQILTNSPERFLSFRTFLN